MRTLMNAARRSLRGIVVTAIVLSTLEAAAEQSQNEGEWAMAARDYANTRHSPLREIATANIGSLRVAWTFSTGINRGQEAAPLVVGDTMFIVTHYPNIVYALDLKKPGHVRWRCARMIALILPTGANLSIVRHRRRLRGASRSRP